MAVPQTAYNTLMGIFRPQQAPAGASVMEQAQADARNQMLGRLGFGLLAAAIPQTAAQRTQSLQQALGGMGDMNTAVYNNAQARLMAQQIEDRQAESKRLSEAAKRIISGGSFAVPAAPAVPISAPAITDDFRAPSPAAQRIVESAPPTAAQPVAQAAPSAPIQLTQADMIRLQNASLISDAEVIKVYDDIIKDKVKKPYSPESEIGKLRNDLNNNIITQAEYDARVAALRASPSQEEYNKKVGTAQFEFETAGANAPQKLAQAELLDSLLAQAGTGKAAVPRNWLTNFMTAFDLSDEELKALGFDKNQTIAGEAATALINKVAMGNIGPGGIPAANFSNADLQFVMRSFASISNLPEANKIIVAIERGKAQAQIDALKSWNKYKKEAGPSADFMQWQIDYQMSLNESGKTYFEEAQKLFEEATNRQEGAAAQAPSAGGEIANGTVAINPTTGERIMFNNGRWLPMTTDGGQ